MFIGVMAKGCMTSSLRHVSKSLEGLHAKSAEAFTSGSLTNKEVKFLTTDLYSSATCANSCALLLKLSILPSASLHLFLVLKFPFPSI